MNKDKILDRMVLGSRIRGDQESGKYAAVVQVAGITQWQDAEALSDWMVAILRDAFATKQVPGGELRSIKPIADDDSCAGH